MPRSSRAPKRRPRLVLPFEMQAYILCFCDPSTLAVASRVSFDFLELTAPLLYRDINVTLGGQTAMLFCDRDADLDHPRLRPHLSLRHTRTFTICDLPAGTVEHSYDVPTEFRGHPDYWDPAPPRLSSSRLDFKPLALDLLTLRPLESGGEFNGNPWEPLFSLFLPTTLHLHALPNPSDSGLPYPPVVDIGPPSARLWTTSLRRIIYTGIKFDDKLALASFLPWNRTEPTLKLVLDFAAEGWTDEGTGRRGPSPVWTLVYAATLGLGPPRGRISCVVARVRSEKARDRIKEVISNEIHGWKDITDMGQWLEKELAEGRIRFEVV